MKSPAGSKMMSPGARWSAILGSAEQAQMSFLAGWASDLEVAVCGAMWGDVTGGIA
jgi:hypothetical protein